MCCFSSFFDSTMCLACRSMRAPGTWDLGVKAGPARAAPNGRSQGRSTARRIATSLAPPHPPHSRTHLHPSSCILGQALGILRVAGPPRLSDSWVSVGGGVLLWSTGRHPNPSVQLLREDSAGWVTERCTHKNAIGLYPPSRSMIA